MRAKPVIVIICTLIIGFILGMLTSAQIRFHKLKPVRVYFSEERFREGFYKTIQPDEKQKAIIEEVLNKYARINSEIQDNFRKEFDQSMSEMRKEIDSNLTKEQIARLKEMDEKRRNMIRNDRNGTGADSAGFRGHRRFQDGNRPGWQGPSDGRPNRPDSSHQPPPPPPPAHL
jgi:recombinational DNA repair protein RecT